MGKTKEKKKITFARWGVRTLAIASSTLAAVDLLKGEFQSGGLLVLGWLMIVIAEKRMFKTSSIEPDSTTNESI
tara:strand:+ start:205 stop:426 length:222 start_codon:yes stop_codon:yes gene_type:complete